MIVGCMEYWNSLEVSGQYDRDYLIAILRSLRSFYQTGQSNQRLEEFERRGVRFRLDVLEIDEADQLEEIRAHFTARVIFLGTTQANNLHIWQDVASLKQQWSLDEAAAAMIWKPPAASPPQHSVPLGHNTFVILSPNEAWQIVPCPRDGGSVIVASALIPLLQHVCNPALLLSN